MATEQELAQAALDRQKADFIAQEQSAAADALARKAGNDAQTAVQDTASQYVPPPVALAAGQVAGQAVQTYNDAKNYISEPHNAREVLRQVGSVGGGLLGAAAGAASENPVAISTMSATGSGIGSAIADTSANVFGLAPDATTGDAVKNTLLNAAQASAADLTGQVGTKIVRNPFAKGLSEEGQTLAKIAEEDGIANAPVAMKAAGDRGTLSTVENATGSAFLSGFDSRKVRIQQAVTDHIKAAIDTVRGNNPVMDPGNLRVAVQDGLNAYKKETFDALESRIGEITSKADQSGLLIDAKPLKNLANSPFMTKALQDVAPTADGSIAQRGYSQVLESLKNRPDSITLSEAYGLRKQLNDIRLNSSGANSLEQTESTAIQDLTKGLDSIIGQSKQGKQLLSNVQKYEDFASDMDTGVLASLASKETGAVGNYLVGQDSVNVDKLRRAVLNDPSKGPSTWKQVQADALNSIMLTSKENEQGVLNGSAIVNKIRQINKGLPGDPGYVDNLSNIVGPDASKNFTDLAKALARAQSNSSKEYQLAIRSAQTATGAAVVLKSGNSGGSAGAAIMLLPGAFNRLMAVPSVAKYLVEGVQKPSGQMGTANRVFQQVTKAMLDHGEKVNLVIDGQHYEIDKNKPMPAQVKRALEAQQ